MYYKRKLFIFCESLGVSGGVRVILQFCSLFKNIFDIKILCFHKTDWYNIDVPVIVFPMYRYKMVEDYLKNFDESIKVSTWWKTCETVENSLNKNDIGLYYVQDIESAYYDNENEKNNVLSTYKNKLIKIAGGDYVYNELKKINNNNNILNLPPYIDEKKFRFYNHYHNNNNNILYCARNNKIKNFELFKNISEKLETKKNIILYGLEQDLQYEIDGSVFVYQPDDEILLSLFDKSDVYVSTSYHEGFCLPILEAFANGLPTVTTFSDGNTFCINEENCLLYDREDAAGIAEGIKRVLIDSDLRKHLIQNGLNTVKMFSMEKYYQNFIDFAENNNFICDKKG